jgi:hypothetical protein
MSYFIPKPRTFQEENKIVFPIIFLNTFLRQLNFAWSCKRKMRREKEREFPGEKEAGEKIKNFLFNDCFITGLFV